MSSLAAALCIVKFSVMMFYACQWNFTWQELRHRFCGGKVEQQQNIRFNGTAHSNTASNKSDNEIQPRLYRNVWNAEFSQVVKKTSTQFSHELSSKMVNVSSPRDIAHSNRMDFASLTSKDRAFQYFIEQNFELYKLCYWTTRITIVSVFISRFINKFDGSEAQRKRGRGREK